MSRGRIDHCPVCRASVEQVEEILPMSKIGEILRGLKEECKDVLEWNQALAPSHRPPTQQIGTKKRERESMLVDLEEPHQSPTRQPSSSTSVVITQLEKGVQWNEPDRVPPCRKTQPTNTTGEPLSTDISTLLSTSELPMATLSPWVETTEGWNSTAMWETGETGETEQDKNDVSDKLFLDPANHIGQSQSELSRSDLIPKISTRLSGSTTGCEGHVAPPSCVDHDQFKDPLLHRSDGDEPLQLRPHYDTSLQPPPVQSPDVFDTTPSHIRSESTFPRRATPPELVHTKSPNPKDTLLSLPHALSIEKITTKFPDNANSRPRQPSLTSPFVNGSKVNRVSRIQVGRKGLYQATAISATCLTIALISPSDFSIFNVPRQETDGTISRKCYGSNNGRLGPPSEIATKNPDNLTYPPKKPRTYSRAVISDSVLAIACEEGCINIHDAEIGKLIGIIEFSQGRCCCSMTMSPNGTMLAVGMESGELFVYRNGTAHNFVTMPILIKEVERKSVNCIAFSPDSLHMSVCTADNRIRTYNLHMNVPTLVSIFDRQLDLKSCRDPYYGVTSLALCQSLLLWLILVPATRLHC